MTQPMPIFIKKFWTEYKPDPKNPGQLREVDYVEYSPIGSVQKLSIPEAVSRLSNVIPLEGRAAQNPAVLMAHARWNAIKPHYEAWKAGHEVPLEGTPLAVWPGVSQELAQLFKMKGVKTVEQVAALTDTHIQSMGIPGLFDIIQNAKRFLVAQDKTAVSSALAEKDREVAELKAQIAELIEIVKETKAVPSPKRRGRPPKVEQVAA